MPLPICAFDCYLTPLSDVFLYKTLLDMPGIIVITSVNIDTLCTFGVVRL